jgi:hypothetical protein
MVDIVRTRRSYSSAAVPVALNNGQLAVNIPDKKIWVGDTGDQPVLIADYNHTAYNHPTHDANNPLLSGALVLSTFTSDTLGHVTGITTRTLTPTNIGAATAGHVHPAVDITYSNVTSGLSASDVQAAIDEIAADQALGVIEFGAVATPLGSGDIHTDVNAMDWTGHEYAVGTALAIELNYLVTFGNNTNVAYRWVGPKGVTVGLGGSYVTTADDYLATGVGSHDALSGLTDVDVHPATSISFNPATSDLTAITTQAAIDEHVNTKSGNPHDVTYAQLGGTQPAPLGHDHDGGIY